MIGAGALHLGLNWKQLRTHMRFRGAQVLGVVLLALIFLLVGVGLARPAHEAPHLDVDQVILTQAPAAEGT